MPNRLAFFDDLFLRKPIFYTIGKAQGYWDAMTKDNRDTRQKALRKARNASLHFLEFVFGFRIFAKLFTRTHPPFHARILRRQYVIT